MLQSTIYLCLKKARAEKFSSVFLEYEWRLYGWAQFSAVIFSEKLAATFFINKVSEGDRGDFWLNFHHLNCKSRVWCLHGFLLKPGSPYSSLMSQCHCRNCTLGTVT